MVRVPTPSVPPGARRALFGAALFLLPLAAVFAGPGLVHAEIHVFAEPALGLALPFDGDYGAVGPAAELSAGVGGQWSAFPLRLYLALGVSWSEHLRDATTRFHRAELQRDLVMGALSLRVEWALFYRIWLGAEVGVGYRWSLSQGWIDGREHLSQTEGIIVPVFGVGLRVPIRRWLSIGLRNTYVWARDLDGPDVPLVAAGLASTAGPRVEARLLVTTSFHF